MFAQTVFFGAGGFSGSGNGSRRFKSFFNDKACDATAVAMSTVSMKTNLAIFFGLSENCVS